MLSLGLDLNRISNSSDMLVNLPMVTSIAGTKKGAVTYTRSSSQVVTDFEGVLRSISSGTAAFGGARVVTNLCPYSNDMTQSLPFINGAGSRTANTIVFTASNNDGWYANDMAGIATGSTVVLSAIMSCPTTKQIRFRIGAVFSPAITVTPAPIRYSAVITVGAQAGGHFYWGIYNDSVGTAGVVSASALQFEDVTAQSTQTVGDYVPTSGSPITKFFGTTLAGAAISSTTLKGMLFEPASTNKCTCYGAIPADALGAELATNGSLSADTNWNKDAGWTISGGVGVATAAASGMYLSQVTTFSNGKMYQITYTVVSCSQGGFAAYFNGSTGVTRTVPGTYTDTLLSIASFYAAIVTVGVTTGTVDNISVKEVVMGIGTKSLYSGSFIQNITNMTLSGDTAAVLSVVDDTAALTAAGLLALCPSGKVYKLDNSAGVAAAYAYPSGATGNTNAHTMHCYSRGGTGKLDDSASGTSVVTFGASGSFSKITAANFTPNTALTKLMVHADVGQAVYFILPQLEELPYATSPMVTQGASATRAATVMTIPTVGNIGFGQGTVYLETNQSALNAGRIIQTADLGRPFYVNSAGSLITFDGTNNPINGGISTPSKIAVRYGNGVLRVANKGVFPNAESPFDGTMGSGATTSIGSDGTGANSFFGYIKNLKIYKKPLTDAQLITMTT